jgi:hypothetical protein
MSRLAAERMEIGKRLHHRCRSGEDAAVRSQAQEGAGNQIGDTSYKRVLEPCTRRLEVRVIVAMSRQHDVDVEASA